MTDRYAVLREAMEQFNQYPWADETRIKIIKVVPALLAERDALREALEDLTEAGEESLGCGHRCVMIARAALGDKDA